MINWQKLYEVKRETHEEIKRGLKPAPIVPSFVPTRASILTPPYPSHVSQRGAHWSASCYPAHANYEFHLDVMKQAGIGWVKFLSDGNSEVGQGDSGLQFAISVRERGMIPVVRFYVPANHRWTDANTYAVQGYVRNGIYCIETINEPDLAYEWSDGRLPEDWATLAFTNWIEHAQQILALGGIPLSPSLASGFIQARGEGAGQLQINPFRLVKNAGIEKFICSIHNYPLNHPIDYPFDDVNQKGTRLTLAEYERVGGPYAWDSQTVEQINDWRASDKNPGDGIYEDDSCFRAVDIFIDMLNEAGYTDVPVFTTEGGPCLTDRHDRRYPRITPVVMQDMIEQELAWMKQYPKRYLGYAWWLWGNPAIGGTGGWGTNQWFWPGGPFSLSNGFIPAVQYLIDTPVNGGGEEPEEPEEPEPLPGEQKPQTVWQIPEWNEATLTPASGYKPGDTVYILTEAKLADDTMSQSLFINVFDKAGRRIDVPVKAKNANGVITSPEFKPTDPYDVPMWKQDCFEVWIDTGGGSDVVSNLHTRYGGIPGVNLYHVGYVLTFRAWTVLQETEPEPEPEPLSLEETIRNTAVNFGIDTGKIPYTPEWAIWQAARSAGLGAALSRESGTVGDTSEGQPQDLLYGGVLYRWQKFALGIAYCVVGDWQNVQIIRY